MASSSSTLLLPLGKSPFDSSQGICSRRFSSGVVRCSNLELKASNCDEIKLSKRRREVIGLMLGASSLFVESFAANGAGLPPEDKPKLCDVACEKELENVCHCIADLVPMVTTESGLQYKDIKVGRGPSPPVGFQVAANYVAMVPSGQIFDSSLEKGQVYIFRVGSGQLAFPKGLTSAPGRPRVAPNSPVIFDVSLEYIPGLEFDEGDE
ncbi:hypothetical protein F8388_010397 [Cannabis sativa]|uniref:peptidylprolyl isomerase n=1 Tax=Cannabis sativa TaxID=3483 RepID=A0A7J6GSS3_CANSA|nr:hypothetical protein F8388_010397 [Cannabis sativa]